MPDQIYLLVLSFENNNFRIFRKKKQPIITITIVIIINTFNITIVIIIIVTITAIAITFCHHNHGATVQGCFSLEFDLLCAATSAEF